MKIKKNITSLIALLLALVMSFALIACGNDDENDNGTNTPPVISASITKLRSADGYKGDIALHASTAKNSNAVSFDGAVEKRGNKVKTTTAEGATARESVIDVGTGYMYTNTEEGYYFSQLMPQGTADYAMFMIDKLLENSADRSIDDLFVYNSGTHTATYEYDGADMVNAYLAPTISAYKNNANLLTLVNNYLRLVSPDPTRPYTAEAVLDMAVALIASQPNLTMGAMISMAAEYGIDVYDLLEKSGLLEKFGIVLDAQTKSKIEARKVAEFVTALDEVLNAVKDDPQILQDATALFNKLFVEDVTVTDLRASLTSIKNLILAGLTVQQVKPLIDKYFGGVVPAYMSEIYAVIVNGVTIEKLDLTVSLEFDDYNNIVGITASGNFAHDYIGDAANFYVLSDNNYKFDFTFDKIEYLSEPDDFEINFAEDAWENHGNTIIAIVHGTLDKDVEVYLETGGKDVVITIPQEITYMSYDAATRTFKFDIQEIKMMYASQIQAGVFDGFGGSAIVDGEETPITVAVQIMPETPEGLLKVLGSFLDRIPSPPESDNGNVTVSPEQ